MKTIKLKSLDKITKEQLNEIISCFTSGKVIVYPTDTVYGLGCVADNVEAIKKIYKIKKRNPQKPLLILVKDLDMLKKYCYCSDKQEDYLKNIWSESRAVSVILKAKNFLSKKLTAGLDSIGVRLPKNDFLLEIMRNLNKPLVSTSLNLSQSPILNKVDDLENYFTEKPDLVIDIGEIKDKKPSKLIDLQNENDVKILRK